MQNIFKLQTIFIYFFNFLYEVLPDCTVINFNNLILGSICTKLIKIDYYVNFTYSLLKSIT